MNDLLSPLIEIHRTEMLSLPLKSTLWLQPEVGFIKESSLGALNPEGISRLQDLKQLDHPFKTTAFGRALSSGKAKGYAGLLIFLFALFFVNSAFAASTSNGVQLNVSIGDLNAPKELSTSLQLLLIFTVLSLAPSIVIMMTSFTRIVVVLSFLRTALGIQQPSNQIVVGLSLFLTAFIMYPIWVEIDRDAITPMREAKIETGVAMDRAVIPLKRFMLKYTREKDLDLFFSMMPRDKNNSPNVNRADPPVQTVIPAFMVSELRTAFQMGFVVFLPFLVIDIVVSSILMAMGMMMLPPAMVTLPLKILVFVLADGWGLIVRSLVLSFQ